MARCTILRAGFFLSDSAMPAFRTSGRCQVSTFAWSGSPPSVNKPECDPDQLRELALLGFRHPAIGLDPASPTLEAELERMLDEDEDGVGPPCGAGDVLLADAKDDWSELFDARWLAYPVTPCICQRSLCRCCSATVCLQRDCGTVFVVQTTSPTGKGHTRV